MDKFLNIFTRENITLFLSIFGSLGTLGTWIYNYIKTRKSFTIEINGYLLSTKGLLIHVQLVNKSSLPLSINEIAVKYNEKEFPCSKIPVKVLEKTNKIGKEVVNHKEYYSMEFPINLPALCGASGYLYFSSETENFPKLSTDAAVVIRSNRGREVVKILKLQNHLPLPLHLT